VTKGGRLQSDKGRGHSRGTNEVSDEESRFRLFFVIPDLIRNDIFLFSIGGSREMRSLNLETLNKDISG
jgi:hypothetical protein